jgi:GAF domain-containing protein
VLRLLTASPRDFTDAEINFAMAVAEQGGIAIQNSINYNKITKLVTELEDQEEFLQNIMDSLNADLFVLDANHRITMVNRTFLKNHKLGACWFQ